MAQKKLPLINSAHGSETRNIINAAIDSINAQGKSIQDLIAEGQLTPTQYAQLVSIVNGNIKRGDVSVFDIDKNKGKFDQTYMSDSLLEQIAGNAPVNATPADNSLTTPKYTDRSITNSKLHDTFLYRGRIEITESIDTVFNDGTYIVTNGNPGTFPTGELNMGWAMDVKRIDTNWVYQTIFKLTNPAIRYIRLVRMNTGVVDEWKKINVGDIQHEFNVSMIPDSSIQNKLLSKNFLYRGRIDINQSIDTVYDDGTYIVSNRNTGTLPPGFTGAAALEVKNIDGSWVYQTLSLLTNPSVRYVRLVRSNTGAVNPWNKYYFGEFDISMIPDGSITPSKLHESALTPGTTNKVYKILMVGNSFALDVTSYLHNIAASAGVDIVIGILYRDGEGLASHYDNAINKTNTYTYYKRVSSAGTATNNTTYSVEFDTAVTDEEWDLITFQQRSGHSEDYTSYQPYLNDLKTYIEGLATNTDVEFAIHQTWAYATSRRTNQVGMYNAVNDAYQQAMNDADIGILIPSGTAIQSARANSYLVEIDDELTNDGIHLGELGDYITGLTMFESLLAGRYKKDLFSDVKYAPNDVTKFHVYLSKVVAKNAVSHPFKITEIQST